MQRGGPRNTIPPPSQRHPPGRRWPLQVIVGVCVVVAAYFGMRLLHHEPAPAATPSAGDTPRPAETPDAIAPELQTLPQVAAPSSDLGPFVGQLCQAETFRILGDIPVAGEIRDLINQAHVADAAARLEVLARANDRDANVALARLVSACATEEPDTRRSTETAQAEASRRAADLSPDTRRRVSASLAFRQERLAALSKDCERAHFDSPAIEQRLRSAAAAGHEASLWQLGNQAAGDINLQRKHWLSAAMLGYLPAQLDLAESLMLDTQRGDDQSNRGRLNFWLEAGGRQSPRGKVLLADCLVSGCTGQPLDTARAASLLQEAVLSGATESLASLASFPAEDAAAPTDEQMFGYNAFLQRLNELGCYGEFYPTNAVHLDDHLKQLALRLSPSGLQAAKLLADDEWREHGAQARTALHCN
jgi:hypothetical protein